MTGEHEHQWVTLGAWPGGPDGETDRLLACELPGCGQQALKVHDEEPNLIPADASGDARPMFQFDPSTGRISKYSDERRRGDPPPRGHRT